MLLGIFLYNGTMFYELKNGTLVETKDAQGNFDLTQVLGNKYLEDVDSEKCVIVDTYSNRCFLISKDLLHHGVSEEVYHKMLDSDETDSNKSSWTRTGSAGNGITNTFGETCHWIIRLFQNPN